MVDFKIKEEVLPVIHVNFEEVKQALQQTIDKYKGLVVTEEELQLCKSDQKELAKIRNNIDNYRKEKKKELSKPITVFENQCKELITMIEKAEKPIKDGIKVFDDKRREEKRLKALEAIREAIELYKLNSKYASRLNILDKYLNLSGSLKSVKDDIEQRCFLLVEEQAKEEELIQAIQQTIENANKDIKTPLQLKDVQYLIDSGASLPDIIKRIDFLKEKIKLAEMPKPEPSKEIKQDIEIKQAIPPLKYKKPRNEQIYFVEFRIEGPISDTSKVGSFLRENNIKYTVIGKGSIRKK